MEGQDAALLAAQPLATLDSLAASLESALPRIRDCIVERRVAARSAEVVEAAQCPVCLHAPRDTFLMPCGHIICRSCSSRLDRCPICRTDITGRNRAFV